MARAAVGTHLVAKLNERLGPRELAQLSVNVYDAHAYGIAQEGDIGETYSERPKTSAEAADEN